MPIMKMQHVRPEIDRARELDRGDREEGVLVQVDPRVVAVDPRVPNWIAVDQVERIIGI